MQTSFSKHQYGVIIEPHSGENALEEVDPFWLTQTLAQHGLVVLRGFESDLTSFSDLIARSSRKITADPARTASTSNAQLVKAGDVEMGLHIENGNLPYQPEAQWFFCEVPANAGSQTTFSDGHVVWEKLSAKTQQILRERPIMYARTIPEQLWKKYLAAEFNLPINDIDESHLRRVSEQVPGQHFYLNQDGSVYSRYKTYAAKPTLFSSNIAFANSILSPSVNYESPRLTWADGSMIAPSLLDEIIVVVNTYTDELTWCSGDVAIIDNTRVMHGRRKILDMNRKIYGGQSFLKQALIDGAKQ